MKMGPLVVLGLILVVLGIIAVAVPTFTFFTTDRVADAGFFTIDVKRPHTLVFNPILGALLLVGGIVLIVVGERSTSSA